MNGNKLALNIHLIKGNRGNLIFKKEGHSLRINRLCGALGFVGSMKQLQKGIEWGGVQDCYYELWNDAGSLWLLYCQAEKGRVCIVLGDLNRELSVFEWNGSVEEFRNAVDGMIERMGRYVFFADYRC